MKGNTKMKTKNTNDTRLNNTIEQHEYNKPSLKLTDRSIKAIKTNFLTPTAVFAVSYRFDECKGMACQGLRLVHTKSKKTKQLRLRLFLDYWHDKQNKRYVLPDYHPEKFNVRKIESRIAELRREYGNPNNLTWDKCINTGEQLKKIKANKEQLNEMIQVESGVKLSSVIEQFFKKGFPKVKDDNSSPHRITIRKLSRWMIGYNDRSKCFTLDEDVNRCGVIRLSKDYPGWDDVFAKYPSTYSPEDWLTKNGKIPGKHGVSMYDSPISQIEVEKLDYNVITKYIDSLTDKVSIKLDLKLAFSHLWYFAKRRGYLKDVINPFGDIEYKKPRKTHMTDWNKKELTNDQLSQLNNGCNDLREAYPGQPQLFQLESLTGRRGETLINLKWSYIQWDEQVINYVDGNGNKRQVITHGIITIPPEANKTQHYDNIPITPSIKEVLDSLAVVRNKKEPWRRFVDWIFVSPRIRDKDILSKFNVSNDYKARLKDPRKCWNELLRITGLEKQVMRKMFRTTFTNKVNRMKKTYSSWDVINVSGHNDTRALENNYLNKRLTPSVISLFGEIDSEYAGAFKTRKSN